MTVAPRPVTGSEARETFPVEGITRASCVNPVERNLKKLDGVLDASVNLATEKATVRYRPGAVGLEDFRRAVEGVGYGVAEAEVQAEGTTEHMDMGVAGRRELSTLRNKTIFALVAGALILLESIPTWSGLPLREWFAWVPGWLTNSYLLWALAKPVQF